MSTSALTQTGSYIPDDDFGKLSWMENFTELLSANPERYGLGEADAVVAAEQFRRFRDAFKITQSRHTRTPSAIKQKDAIRAAAVGTMRNLAQIIRSNLGVDNECLSDLGLSPRYPGRREMRAPTTVPVINVRAAFALVHEMTFQDETTSTSRRKPRGVKLMKLQWSIVKPGATVRGVNPSMRCDGSMLVTKTPFLVQFEEGVAGSTAVYMAQWVTATGLTGPWSVPCWFTIAAGGGMAESGGGTPAGRLCHRGEENLTQAGVSRSMAA